MSCNQQPPNITPTGAVPNSRAPLSTTAGYSIQESRRRMLETIDRRRNEMLNTSNAVAAASAASAAMPRGPQIGMIGSSGAMPRLQSGSSLIRNYDQQHGQSQPSSSSTDQQRLSAMNSNRRNGFMSSFPTANGGSFTHMKFPPGRGGGAPAPVQQPHPQQQAQLQQLLHNPTATSRSHPGSLAAVPAGALRGFSAAAAATMAPGSGLGLAGTNLVGTPARYAPPNAVVQAPADSSMAGSRQQHQHPHQHPASRSRNPHAPQQRSRAAASTASQTAPPNVPTQATQMPPVFPDIAMQPHPFYDHLAPVMQPTALMPLRQGLRLQSAELTFTLTQEQAEMVALTRIRHPVTQRTEYGVQVQLRCFKIAPGPQNDCFPPGVSLAVNKNQVTSLPPPLPTNKPNADPIRPGRPVNISGHCRISHAVLNRLTLSWLHDPSAIGYCVTVGLVRSLTAEQLTERLLAQKPISLGETRARIAELLGAGGSGAPDELSMTDLTASLRCPLSRGRIRIPAKGAGCAHVQCFDAPTFLAMNERKPGWRCPCCDRQLPLADLRIDDFFRHILAAQTSAPPVETVRFLPDGGWTPVVEGAPDGASASAVSSSGTGTPAASGAGIGLVVDLTEDAVAVSSANVPTPVANAKPPPSAAAKAAAAALAAPVTSPAPAKRSADTCGPDGILVITLDSSDDEADHDPGAKAASMRPPPSKRPRRPMSVGNLRTGSPALGNPTPAYPGSGNPNSPASLMAPHSDGVSSPAADFRADASWGYPPGNPVAVANPGSPGLAAASSAAPLPHFPAADSIPLPAAFLQDQQRLSAMLAATAFQRHQQQQNMFEFDPARF